MLFQRLLTGNFLNTTKVGVDKEKLLELLRETLTKNAIVMNDKKLNDVYLIACKVYEGKLIIKS